MLDFNNFEPEPVRGNLKRIFRSSSSPTHPAAITFEAKLDGARYLLSNQDGIQLVSRRKNVNNTITDKVQRVPHIGEIMSKLSTKWVVDGEIYHGAGLGTTVGMINSLPDEAVRKQNEQGKLIYYAFDIISVGDELLTTQPLFERRKWLLRFLEEINNVVGLEYIRHVPIVWAPDSPADNLPELEAQAQKAFEVAVTDGYEGIIVKNLRGAYHRTEWAKIKTVASYDYIIVGIVESESDTYAGYGAAAIELGLYGSDGKLVRTGTCSGLTDIIRRDMFVNPNNYIGRVVEVSAQLQYPNGALRHGVYRRLRDDLTPQDQTFAKYRLEG